MLFGIWYILWYLVDFPQLSHPTKSLYSWQFPSYSLLFSQYTVLPPFVSHFGNLYMMLYLLSGTVSSRTFSEAHQLNYYYYQTCSWTLDSNVERQLTVDVESTQNRES